MFRRFLVSCITVLLALALPASVLAQDYYFAVDQETVQVYWNEDGTLRWITSLSSATSQVHMPSSSWMWACLTVPSI